MTTDLSKPLNEKELNDLASFLDRSGGARPYAYAEGLLTAIASAPRTIPPNVWLAAVFPGQFWESMEEYEADVQPLMRLYNSIIDGLRRGDLALWTAFEDNVELIEWCAGYLEIVDSDEIWGAELIPDAPSLAPWYAVVGKRSALDALSAPLDHLRVQIPRLAMEMYSFWSEWRLNPSKSGDRAPGAVSIRTGRNEPCPCGSGRKFKRCCGK